LKEHLPALTGLRFLLAFWVILDHLTGPGGALDGWAGGLPQPVYAVIRGGYLAVATFFVLSGFVLAHGYGSGKWPRERLRRYAVARFARIYPVYALSMLLVAPFMVVYSGPGKAGLIANYGLVLQGWTGRQRVGWNTPAWSLSCEIFFYCCFPFIGWLIRALASPAALAAVAGTACLLPRLLTACGLRDEWKPLVHFADFLMGIAAWVWYSRFRERGWSRLNPSYIYIAAGLGSAAVIAWPEVLPPLVDLNSALRPLNGLLVAGLAAGSGYVARLLASPVSVYLGKSSYAMYILHIPLVWWARRWSPTYSAWIYIVAVVAISLLVYRFLEEPANRYIRSKMLA
jgi:peptidoglycan/LPS O-acetylase OafA/YrhL